MASKDGVTPEPAPSDGEEYILHKFIHGMTRLTNLVMQDVRPELLADALISGGVELMRKLYGPNVAADRLRQAADVIEEANPVQRH